MKKSLIICLIFSVLICSTIISAIEVNMKEEFNQGETFLAKVSGTFFTTLAEENIYFYRGYTRVPATPHIIKIEDEYYVYAQLLGK